VVKTLPESLSYKLNWSATSETPQVSGKVELWPDPVQNRNIWHRWLCRWTPALPNSGGSPLFMPTLFNAERSNSAWKQMWRGACFRRSATLLHSHKRRAVCQRQLIRVSCSLHLSRESFAFRVTGTALWLVIAVRWRQPRAKRATRHAQLYPIILLECCGTDDDEMVKRSDILVN